LDYNAVENGVKNAVIDCVTLTFDKQTAGSDFAGGGPGPTLRMDHH